MRPTPELISEIYTACYCEWDITKKKLLDGCGHESVDNVQGTSNTSNAYRLSTISHICITSYWSYNSRQHMTSQSTNRATSRITNVTSKKHESPSSMADIESVHTDELN
ncbi:hypothetical protein M8J76_009750 [Diaphorina citri]|nr:hypothetical protein M8J75_000385 [Diaphorina citri]KAI5741033.1 hypothetical protein M8J76_009750 [Diaphorina citri]